MRLRSTRRANVVLIAAYGLLFAFALFLLFDQLDKRPLWGDEAETALLAKNVLRFGLPKTIDGVNHITVLGNFRDENSAHVWTWAPWLQEYITAGSFLVFGATTWASRAPFAAIAWLSVVLLAYVSYQIYRKHTVALAGALLLATSEIFLLHSRQCRYYAITVFAEILLIYGAYELLANRKRAIWLLAAALTLQFYTNFVIAAANVPLLISVGWFVWKQREVLRKLVAALVIFLVLATPWLLYAQPWRQSRELIREDIASKALYYFTEWHFHFVPWIFLLLPAIGLFIKKSQSSAGSAITTRLEEGLSILVPGYFAILLLPPSELRYLLPLLPVGCLLASAWLFRYLPWTGLAVALVVLQAISNLAAVATTLGMNRDHNCRLPLIEFIGGLNEDYTNRFADVLTFFSKEAHAGQTVWVADPEFPLIFYSSLRVIDARLSPPDSMPDWILPQSASGLFVRPLAIPESAKPYYDQVIIPVHDSDRFDSVPEPDVYQYRTTPKRSEFVLYRKKM